MCKELSCSECTQTANHCCLADIPYSIVEAIYYKHKATEMGIECIPIPHPNAPRETATFMLVDESMRGQDITKRNCIFMKSGKCSIYEDRPTICRAYGTACMPCRYEDTDLTTKEQIEALTRDDIHALDSMSNKDEIFERTFGGLHE